MKNFKKLFIYIFISILITLFACNIWLKFDSGYFEKFSIAITNSNEEILVDEFNSNVLALKESFINDEATAHIFKETYDSYYSLIPADVENKDAFLVALITTVLEPAIETLAIKYEMAYYAQALIAGIILGTVIYFIININFKFSWLKLLLGFIVFLAIIFITGGLVIGIENVIHFHLTKYIFWSIVAYAIIIGVNLTSQKIKINILNKNLNKITNK